MATSLQAWAMLRKNLAIGSVTNVAKVGKTFYMILMIGNDI